MERELANLRQKIERARTETKATILAAKAAAHALSNLEATLDDLEERINEKEDCK